MAMRNRGYPGPKLAQPGIPRTISRMLKILRKTRRKTAETVRVSWLRWNIPLVGRSRIDLWKLLRVRRAIGLGMILISVRMLRQMRAHIMTITEELIEYVSQGRPGVGGESSVLNFIFFAAKVSYLHLQNAGPVTSYYCMSAGIFKLMCIATMGYFYVARQVSPLLSSAHVGIVKKGDTPTVEIPVFTYSCVYGIYIYSGTIYVLKQLILLVARQKIRPVIIQIIWCYSFRVTELCR